MQCSRLRGDDTDASAEIHSTLTELVASFGQTEVAFACGEIGLIRASEITNEKTKQALRTYTLLLLDSPHHCGPIPKIVARLCELDTAAGHELRQEDIAREIGVTKAQVCNMEAQIAQKLGLPRRSSEKARTSHRLMNLRNYAIRESTSAA